MLGPASSGHIAACYHTPCSAPLPEFLRRGEGVCHCGTCPTISTLHVLATQPPGASPSAVSKCASAHVHHDRAESISSASSARYWLTRLAVLSDHSCEHTMPTVLGHRSVRMQLWQEQHRAPLSRRRIYKTSTDRNETVHLKSSI